MTHNNVLASEQSEEPLGSSSPISPWPEVGVSVSSEETLLEQDLATFLQAITMENGEDYFFYLSQLENAIDVQMTISHHYNRYLTSAFEVTNDVKQLEFKTPEMKFVKHHYLQGVSQHVKTVEMIEPHINAINSDTHPLSIISEFNGGITLGNEEIALAFIQILKIIKKTDMNTEIDLRLLEEHVQLYYEAS
jgi:hypothetical protein